MPQTPWGLMLAFDAPSDGPPAGGRDADGWADMAGSHTVILNSAALAVPGHWGAAPHTGSPTRAHDMSR